MSSLVKVHQFLRYRAEKQTDYKSQLLTTHTISMILLARPPAFRCQWAYVLLATFLNVRRLSHSKTGGRIAIWIVAGEEQEREP